MPDLTKTLQKDLREFYASANRKKKPNIHPPAQKPQRKSMGQDYSDMLDAYKTIDKDVHNTGMRGWMPGTAAAALANQSNQELWEIVWNSSLTIAREQAFAILLTRSPRHDELVGSESIATAHREVATRSYRDLYTDDGSIETPAKPKMPSNVYQSY